MPTPISTQYRVVLNYADWAKLLITGDTSERRQVFYYTFQFLLVEPVSISSKAQMMIGVEPSNGLLKCSFIQPKKTIPFPFIIQLKVDQFTIEHSLLHFEHRSLTCLNYLIQRPEFWSIDIPALIVFPLKRPQSAVLLCLQN